MKSADAGVEMTSAFLWLHKNRDVGSSGGGRLTLKLSSVDDDDDLDSSRSRSRRYELSWMSGWIRLDIGELVWSIVPLSTYKFKYKLVWAVLGVIKLLVIKLLVIKLLI